MRLLCIGSKVVGRGLVTTESHFREAEYAAYLDGLVNTGVYVSAGAMRDPALRPMRAIYLGPNNVLSMLDAAFMVNGRAFGMVCCEQNDAIRQWRPGETCNFTTLDGTQLFYRDRIEARWPLRLMLDVAAHVPLHCTAGGQLFLAQMPGAARDALIAQLPRPRMTRGHRGARARGVAGAGRSGGATAGTASSGRADAGVPVKPRFTA